MNTTRQKRIAQGLCAICGTNKPDINAKSCSICKNKRKEYRKSRPNEEKKSKDRSNAKRKQHCLENHLCSRCGKQPPVENRPHCLSCIKYIKNWASSQRCKFPNKANEYHQKVRLEVIHKYGSICECCGETQIEFLAIDHKNNDGHIERKSSCGTSSAWYLKLRREPRRTDLRILCHNCNMARSLYGICPHQKANRIHVSSNHTGVK